MHAPDYPEVGESEMIRLQDQPWPMPVFTHGDLGSLNILVRGDDIVRIVDRETAGMVSIILGVHHAMVPSQST